MVLYVVSKQSPQSRGPATDIQKITYPIFRDSIHDSGCLFQPKMSLCVLQILFGPKLVFVILLAHLSHEALIL